MVRAIKPLIFVAVLLVSASRAGVAQAGEATPRTSSANSELRLILNRYVQSLLPTEKQAIDAVVQAAAKDASSLGMDGSWADINYNDTNRADWAAADHLQRLLVMAKSSQLHRATGAADRGLDSAVLRGFRYWLDRDLQNSNWWWNEIGVPQLVGEISSAAPGRVPAQSHQHHGAV
jgi:chondroitin AC lyase